MSAGTVVVVSLIVAVARNGVIGRQNRLPWHLPRDLRRFRSLTWGKSIIMGRRTFESLPRPLEGRYNIVLTRRPDLRPAGVQVVRSLVEALACAAENAAGNRETEAFVIGGAEVFRVAFPLARRVYLTTVEADVEGDVWFPADTLRAADWTTVREEHWPADEKNSYPHRFAVLERTGQAMSSV